MTALLPTPRAIFPGYEHLAGRAATIPPCRAVSLLMDTPALITVSQAADKYRWVTGVDSEPGRWRSDLVPHTVKAMDIAGQPWVREVWVCGVERSAKTQWLLNYLLWATKFKPGNVFWLEPAEEDAGKNVKTKIIPMYRESKHMRRYLSDRADDTGKTLITFRHGMHLFPAHSNSIRSLSNFFGLHNAANEVDKYPLTIGPEADPINILYKRGRDVRNAKFLFASTPAGKFIYKGMLKCRQIWTWGSRCPFCGELLQMDDEHLFIPPNATAADVKNGSAEISYRCNACEHLWSEDDRQHAYATGYDLCLSGAEIDRPSTVGFHWPALNIGRVPLAETAEKMLLSKTGDLAARRDYFHGYRCIDHKEEISDRKEDTILRLRDSRPAGQVPAEAAALSISIDTQDKGFWYEIRAWRYGLDLKSWLVKAGYVPSANANDFSGPDALLSAEYPDANGEPHRIMAGVIDSAGHRTSEVYAWCRRSGILPSRGASNRKTQPVTISRIDRYPGSNTPIPGGLNLYSLDTHYHKDLLANKLLIDPTDPGAWVLHSGYTPEQLATLARDPGSPQAHNLESYARQFCVEGRDERGLWQCPEGKDNHLWDCAQMGLALVMYLGWQHVRQEESQPTVSDRPKISSSQSRRRW